MTTPSEDVSDHEAPKTVPAMPNQEEENTLKPQEVYQDTATIIPDPQLEEDQEILKEIYKDPCVLKAELQRPLVTQKEPVVDQKTCTTGSFLEVAPEICPSELKIIEDRQILLDIFRDPCVIQAVLSRLWEAQEESVEDHKTCSTDSHLEEDAYSDPFIVEAGLDSRPLEAQEESVADHKTCTTDSFLEVAPEISPSEQETIDSSESKPEEVITHLALETDSATLEEISSTIVPSTSEEACSSTFTARRFVSFFSSRWTTERVKVAMAREILKEACHFLVHQVLP